MNQEYERHSCLDDLLAENDSAKEFYRALPDYVQGALQQNSEQIHSEEDLRQHAQVQINSFGF